MGAVAAPRVSAGTRRADVDVAIGRLRELRNRVAHHEPLFPQDLRGRLDDLLAVAGLLHAELRNDLSTTSALPDLLAARP